jgi:hypothetical protein
VNVKSHRPENEICPPCAASRTASSHRLFTAARAGIEGKEQQMTKMPKRERHVGQTWKLRSGLLYAGLDASNHYAAKAVGPDDALVFDSRDIQGLKLRFFSAVLRMPFEVEEVAT